MLHRLGRRLLHSFAALGAAIPVFRPGTSVPASSGVLSAAPLHGAPSKARAPSAGRLRRSLRLAMGEGVLAETIGACAGGAVLTGWALFLQCSPLLLGFIISLPQLAQIFQAPAARLTQYLGHRRAAIWTLALSRQALIPLVFLPFLPLSLELKQILLVMVSAAHALFAVLGNNAWVAWMGDLVPRSLLGRYFGRRTAYTTAAGAVTAVAAGLWLDHLKSVQLTGAALSGLAAVACMAGAVTIWLLNEQHDPRAHEPATPPCGSFLRNTLTPYRDRRIRPLLVYQICWNSAVGLAAAYFGLHMLKNLKLGFFVVALHGIAVAVARLLAAPLFGKAIDRFGARPMLAVSSFGIASLPLLWLLPRPGWLWPLAVDAVISGVLWGSHAVAAFALPLTLSPRQGRPYYLAAFATVGGAAFALSTYLAGSIVQWAPETFTVGGHQFVNIHILFALSGCARFLTGFVALKIEEPRARPVPALLRHLVESSRPSRRRPRPLTAPKGPLEHPGATGSLPGLVSPSLVSPLSSTSDGVLSTGQPRET